MRAPDPLLEAGEREPVVEFLEAMRGTNVAHRSEVEAWADAIRRGRRPELRHRWLLPDA